jgi:hypothetical protein
MIKKIREKFCFLLVQATFPIVSRPWRMQKGAKTLSSRVYFEAAWSGIQRNLFFESFVETFRTLEDF